MIRVKRINRHIVTPIDVPKVNPNRIKGYDLIPRLYCTIFVCAKKESGKTNAIFKILRECTGKKTHLYVVANTVFNDDNWIAIVDYFENRGIEITVSTTLEEAQIPEKVRELKEIAMKEAEERKKNEKPKLSLFPDEEEEKERKPKKVAPEYIFVFDDMSHALRDNSISELIKMHRHFKTKVILSSQYPNDLAPESRKNINIFLLFAGHSEKKLFELYDNMDLKIPFNLFVKLYENATSKPYNFLYVDTKGEFRRNFNTQYMIT